MDDLDPTPWPTWPAVTAPPAPPYAPSPWPPPPDDRPARSSAGWMGFDPDGPKPRWGMPDILLGLACWLGVQLIFGIAAVLIFGADKLVIGIAGLLGSWVGMVGYLVLISRWKGLGSLRADFGWDFRWIDPLLGLGVGIVTIIVSVMVRVGVAAAFGTEPAGNAEQIFGDVQDNKVAVIVLALMAAIGAPIVEELFFRGLALRAIERRLGPIVAIVASSLLFAMLHWQGDTTLGGVLSLVAGILVYGTFFALVTRATGRLGPATFAHMTINSLASAILVYSVFSCGSLSC